MIRSRRSLAGVLWVMAVLASCAPPPPGELTRFAVRYEAERVRREARLVTAQAEWVVRIDGRATGRLPGLLVSTALASPDRLRMRASWMLGTAMDGVAQGDRLRVWLPSEHALLEIPELTAALHGIEPVGLLRTAWCAGWEPPANAWALARSESSLVRVAWRAGPDSLTLLADGAGRPQRVRIERAGRTLEVRYAGWRRLDGLDWPMEVSVADSEGWVKLRTELQALRPAQRAREDWFELRFPSDADTLDWEAVRARLSVRKEP